MWQNAKINLLRRKLLYPLVAHIGHVNEADLHQVGFAYSEASSCCLSPAISKTAHSSATLIWPGVLLPTGSREHLCAGVPQ